MWCNLPLLFGRWNSQFSFLLYYCDWCYGHWGKMLLTPYYYWLFCSWCYWNHVGVRGSPWPWCYWNFIWILILVAWPTPHPICVAVGICQYFYLGMGHLLLLIMPIWWSWQCLGSPRPLYWNCPEIPQDQWCHDGHG